MTVEVFVGHSIVDKCYKFADSVCKSYAAGRKEVSRNMQVPSKPRIDQDVEIQYTGRIAEYAACLYLGQDPERSLNWGVQCDNGYDFIFYGVSIDVKATNNPRATRLIWPISKNHLLKSASDVFIFARVLKEKRGRLGQAVELVGFVTKHRFISECQKAASIPGIVDGTLFIDEKDLDELSTILHN